MRTRVGKTWSFDAAHVIPHHNGKCAQPHGHTYTVRVEVEGVVLPVDGRPDGGMVVDFYVLTQAWKKIEPSLDHQDLNETLGRTLEATTSELMAAYLFDFFSEEVNNFDQGLKVVAVQVSETPSSYARVTA